VRLFCHTAARDAGVPARLGELEQRSTISPYLTLAILISVAMLQTTVAPHLQMQGVRPDLMLLVVTSWSLLRGARAGMLWAVGGGLLLDLLSGGPFGALTIALTLASLVAGVGELNVFHGSPWLPLLASMLATVVYDLVQFVVLLLLGRAAAWDLLLQVLAPSLLVNALATYPAYWAARWLHHRTPSEAAAW